MAIRIRVVEKNVVAALKTWLETVLQYVTDLTTFKFDYEQSSAGTFRGTLIQVFVSVGDATAVGTPGLDDATSGGTYTGTEDARYDVEIDLAAATDTFQWRKDGGTWTTDVTVTGSAQTLSDGVTVTFGATTGHTLGDAWTIDTMIA